MQITNELVPESFCWKNTGKALTDRVDEIVDLVEVVDYCRELGEKVYCASSVYDQEVEEDTTLPELLYGLKKGGNADAISYLLQLFSKGKITWETAPEENPIACSCGKWNGAEKDLRQYVLKRQRYLKTLKKPMEYAEFMRSCFPNSVFSDECNTQLRYIEDFKNHVAEITDCLSLLDEKAVALFEKYSDNLEFAMKLLETELGNTCAPDLGHQKQLVFEFCYDEKIKDEIQLRKKQVVCHPHVKLCRDNSDLRVYFQWKDSTVGDGKKVLIGRIGRHPYGKRT